VERVTGDTIALMKTAIPLWDIPSLPVVGSDARFPIRRVFCVGRNYVEHQKEMGSDGREQPFFFAKAPHDVLAVNAGSEGAVNYPPMSADYHWETEMVVAIGKPGFRVSQENAHELIYGYGAGLDMTRRDLQLVARDKGRPWDLGKDVEHSSVCSDIVPMLGQIISSGAIALEVNGVTKQSSDVNKLIWNVREIIADLSLFYHLQPGDLIYTGTPEGVGPVVSGDTITGRIAGVADISLTVGPAN